MPFRTPLHAVEEQNGASFLEWFSWEIARDFGNSRDEYEAANDAAATFDVSYVGKLRVTGRDRVRYLHSMLSNDIRNLKEGSGCYATLLTHQGKMESDVFVYAAGEEIWLECPPAGKDGVVAALLKYIVADHVFVEDWTERLAVLSVQGPRARACVESALSIQLGALEPLAHRAIERPPGTWRVVCRDRSGSGGYDLWLPAGESERVWTELTESGASRPAGHDALNILRTEAGIPWFGVDMDVSNLPMEFGLDSALSFTKGCYRGQEIVARVTHRGRLDRRLGGIALRGAEIPARGSEVKSQDGKAGEVTSAVPSPRLGTPLALAVLKLSALAPGTAVEVVFGDSAIPGAVVALPLRG